MSSVLTIEFPSDEHRDAFTGWFSNIGEQDFSQQADYEEESERHLYDLGFNNKTDSLIVATEFED